MDYIISSEHSGKKVLDYLKKELMISRAELTALKSKEKGIVLNGIRVTVRAIMSEGDVLSLDRQDASDDQNENIVPSDIPLEIIYEDDDMIAVNKPFNMPTHPSHGHYDDTLANGLVFRFKKLGVPFVFRAVNRLDRDTSGIVLVAKNKHSAFELSKQISDGSVKKRYTAVVHGVVSENGKIIKNIKRRAESIIERIVCPDNEGQYSETHYFPLASDGSCTVLGIEPKTGRTHQIRVHLSSIGHPIIGDTLYGCETSPFDIRRQALHCSEMVLKRVSDGMEISLFAPLQEDMKAVCHDISNKNILKIPSGEQCK